MESKPVSGPSFLEQPRIALRNARGEAASSNRVLRRAGEKQHHERGELSVLRR